MTMRAWIWVSFLGVCACGTQVAPAESPEPEQESVEEAPPPAQAGSQWADEPEGAGAQPAPEAPPRRHTRISEDSTTNVDIDDESFDEAPAQRPAPQPASPPRRAKKAERPQQARLEPSPERLAEWLVASQRELDQVLALAEPDCEAARQFRQMVCKLADRICDISDSVDSAQVSRCRDGRQRCAQSRTAYAKRCE